MALAFFDMDGTVLESDSNEIFFKFLMQQGIITEDFLKPLGEFQRRYYEGTLSIEEFILYAVEPMFKFSKQERESIVKQCVEKYLYPNIKPGAFKAIDFHKKRGDTVIMVSATVDYLVKEVARSAGIQHIIAASIKQDDDGRLLKEFSDPVPYQQGKVLRINKFIKEHRQSLADSYGYGDSINDKQMLLMCEHRFAVDPSPELIKAGIKDLKIISWK